MKKVMVSKSKAQMIAQLCSQLDKEELRKVKLFIKSKVKSRR